MRVDIADVQIDNVTKAEAIEKIDSFVQSGKSHYIVTPYSEMIVFAQGNLAYREVLNNSSLSLPDGVGILWAAKFLSLPKHNALWTWSQVKYSLLAIPFNKKFIRSVIKEQVTGSRLVYDLAKLASEKNYSLALVGGSGNVAAQAAYKLKKLYPNLNIKLALSDRPFDGQIIKEINETNSDILLLAYSPPKQEMWLAENYLKLNTKAAIGLGGTFDYLAGKRAAAPNFMHQAGLEWLWRLITQPWRIKRMWNAIPVFVWKIYKYKLTKNHDRN
jgi:N-acetylglucosaminyldiphosphoundecaprenol N-acetyl-beta-D-mannosaminyltransferase